MMELTVQDYAKKLEAGDYAVSEATLTATKIQQKTTWKTAIQSILDHLAAGELARQNWTVNTRGDSISVRLECNLINIPMDEALRLDGKLLKADTTYPVNLYLVVESPDVNRTGLRIDSLVDNPGADADANTLAEQAQVWVTEKLGMVMQNRQAAKEAAKKTTKAAKTTSKTGKKTTRKSIAKTTKKRSTTRRSSQTSK